MRPALTPQRVADDVIEFQVNSPAEAQALAHTLRSEGLAEDVVAGLDRVAVCFHPQDADRVDAWLGRVRDLPEPELSEAPIVDIEVSYGGEAGMDFDHVCAALGLTAEAFIALHTATVHTVEMIGFTPGFAYISGLPDGMAIPRLETPRPRVAAGSVGISAAYTGLYALAGPGGWPVIGRTAAPLFVPDRAEPFLLQPGQRVRFKAV